MDTLRRSHSHRHPSPAGKQHFSGPISSKRINPTKPPPATTVTSPNNSNNHHKLAAKHRSKSTGKSRNDKEEENRLMMTINPSLIINTTKKPQRKSTSPSAWALSPRRASPCLVVVPPSSGGKTGGSSGGAGGGGGMSGVLKYFKHKKVEKIDHHCFKVMHNRLLQWRFANARAHTTMLDVQIIAQEKAFNVWVKIVALRNTIMRKQMQVEKLKYEIKVYQIIDSQLFLLEKWSKMEAKHIEAVSRVVRKLNVASINLQLIHDSKGDISTVRDVLDTATRLMENIESTIMKFYSQVEKSCYLLTELSIITKQQKEYLEELQTWILIVSSLKEKERSLRVQLIQAPTLSAPQYQLNHFKGLIGGTGEPCELLISC